MNDSRQMAANVETPEYFQHEQVPRGTQIAGWSAIVKTYGIDVPLRYFACVSDKHISGNRRIEDKWEIFDKRYLPENSFAGHLNFAFRHESIDLLVIKRVFEAISNEELCNFILSTPTGAIARRVWFFYETLTGNKLDIKDASTVTAVDALDPDKYFTVKGALSQRHRIRDNLLGVGEFCPIIRKTEKLEKFISLNLAQKAQETIGKTGAQVAARAASFMLLADSKASFKIEGEKPPGSKLERWGRAVLEAGKRPLNQSEIYRLHQIIIGDTRFTQIGYRSEGVFLGERDHDGDPLPEFIGARHEDLPEIMLGLNDCNNRLKSSDLDAVLQAAAIAFGFVYIHPLTDGNGRLHRCLIHHVLAERKFTPPGMIFPVSSVMALDIETYRNTLQSHSSLLMDYIDWRVSPYKNVEVTNDTADLYKYYDCTENAEFLYDCVRQAVEIDLPREIDYLKRHDEALNSIMEAVEMPDRLAQDLLMSIKNNKGELAQKRRKRQFEKLTDEEITVMEGIVNSAFEGFEDTGHILN